MGGGGGGGGEGEGGEEEEEEAKEEGKSTGVSSSYKFNKLELVPKLAMGRAVKKSGPGREENRFGPPGFLRLGPGSKN